MEEDYDVHMDVEEEGEVFMREATTGHWWMDCGNNGNDGGIQHQRGGRGRMVNSRSWAEELQDIFAPQTEDCYSGGRTRLSSISVSDCLYLSVCLSHTNTEQLSLSPSDFTNFTTSLKKTKKQSDSVQSRFLKNNNKKNLFEVIDKQKPSQVRNHD